MAINPSSLTLRVEPIPAGTLAPSTTAPATQTTLQGQTSADILRLADLYAQEFAPGSDSSGQGPGQYVVYTPATNTSAPSSGVNVQAILVLGGLAVAGFFLYKHFHKGE